MCPKVENPEYARLLNEWIRVKIISFLKLMVITLVAANPRTRLQVCVVCTLSAFIMQGISKTITGRRLCQAEQNDLGQTKRISSALFVHFLGFQTMWYMGLRKLCSIHCLDSIRAKSLTLRLFDWGDNRISLLDTTEFRNSLTVYIHRETLICTHILTVDFHFHLYLINDYIEWNAFQN